VVMVLTVIVLLHTYQLRMIIASYLFKRSFLTLILIVELLLFKNLRLLYTTIQHTTYYNMHFTRYVVVQYLLINLMFPLIIKYNPLKMLWYL